MEPQENKECYASPELRRLLRELAQIAPGFFLTGGTALSVFYLHHRISEDIDLFTIESGAVARLADETKRKWPETRVRKQTETFFSATIGSIKVDFVESPNESPDTKPIVDLDGQTLTIDSFDNIIANKLTTLVSRCDPKDIIDFHFGTTFGTFDRETLLKDAARKEGLFDDPASAAFAIEENLARARGLSEWPDLLIAVERDTAIASASGWVGWLYELGGKGTKDILRAMLWLPASTVPIIFESPGEFGLTGITAASFYRKDDYRLGLVVNGPFDRRNLSLMGVAPILGSVQKGADTPSFVGTSQGRIVDITNAWPKYTDTSMPKETQTITYEPHAVELKSSGPTSLAKHTLIYFLNGCDADILNYDAWLQIRAGGAAEAFSAVSKQAREGADSILYGPPVLTFSVLGAPAYFGRLPTPRAGNLPGSLLVICADVAEPRKIAHDFATLLNFLLDAEVIAIGCNIYDSGLTEISQQYWNVTDALNLLDRTAPNPLVPFGFRHRVERRVDLDVGKEIGSLFETYRKQKETYGLQKVLWYFNESRNLAFELQVHPLSTALDLLTTAWFKGPQSPSKGRNLPDQEYSDAIAPFLEPIKGKLTATSADPIMARIRNANSMGFTQRQSTFFEELGLPLSAAEKDLLKFRNVAIHGELGDWDSQERVLRTGGFRSLLGRTILSLLEYDGPYIDYSTLGFPLRSVRDGAELPTRAAKKAIKPQP